MTMTPEAETLARKIDETRTDVKILHPLMQLLDTEDSNPAAEFAARLIKLLTEMRTEQQTLTSMVKKVADNAQATPLDPKTLASLETHMTAFKNYLKPLPDLMKEILEAQIATSTRLNRIEAKMETMNQLFGQILD
jgi:DNA repair ATPase RecN